MPPATELEKDKVARVVDYLRRLASLRAKIIRDWAEYPHVLWIHEIPHEGGCFTCAWGEDREHDRDIWVQVQASDEPTLPQVPEICRDWIDPEGVRNTKDLPELRETIVRQEEILTGGNDRPQFVNETLLLAEHPNIKSVWERYLEEKWMPWAEEHNKWESVQRVYSKLFSIYQEQLRLGEEYELVLGIGLLRWHTPSNQHVRRHLVAASAALDFEARLGKFTVRPHIEGANLRPELDMLEIGERPVGGENAAREGLAVASDDPWDTQHVKDVLSSFVHSLSAYGEFHDLLEPENTPFRDNPILEYAPALILRKRSVRGLTDVLERIKEQVIEGGEIPPLFADLAEISIRNSFADEVNEEDTATQPYPEVYFPKPSNEKQRKIIERMHRSDAVLVQGPPGTGKSHTIANLICHLLATGKRTLVTAKTPRALQVLHGLLPEELRPLSISLLGSGPAERESLEKSVAAILRENEQNRDLFYQDEPHAQPDFEELENDLARLREEKAEVENRLSAIRESESHPHSVGDGAYNGTAAQIARRIQVNASRYDWFADEVPFDISFPLGIVNFAHLLQELRRLTPERRNEASQNLPDSIPSPEEFRALVDRERDAKEEESSTSQNLNDRFLAATSWVSPGDLCAFRRLLSESCADMERLKQRPHGWIPEAIRDVLSGNDSVWRERLCLSENIVNDIGGLIEGADSVKIATSETQDDRAILDDALTLRKHLSDGGKLGWGPFRPKVVKEVKYLIRDVRIGGHLCNTLERVSKLIDALRARIELERGWNLWAAHSEKPKGSYALQIQALRSQLGTLSSVLALEEKIAQCRNISAKYRGFPEPVWHDGVDLRCVIQTCDHALVKAKRQEMQREIEESIRPWRILVADRGQHSVAKEMLEAMEARDVDVYARAFKKVEDLNADRKAIRHADETLMTIRQHAPLLQEGITASNEGTSWEARLGSLPDAWRWAQARTWLSEYVNKEDDASLSRRLSQLEKDIEQCTAKLAARRAWRFCFSRMSEDHRRHMVLWQQSMTRLGRGTGRHAPKYRREGQKHLNQCRDAVPAWVMPLHRVWDTVDPMPGAFDVIIVDEASQCGFEAFPLFWLAKKILIVGDDKQISPEAVGILRDDDHHLREELLKDLSFRSSFNVDASLFDQGKIRCGQAFVTLREHFRCMPEIIQFSNDLCYSNTPLIPLRQAPRDRLSPLMHVYVRTGYREGSGDRVINKPEASAIADKIEEMCRNERYKRKTIGVVVLQGNAQGGLIESLLLQRLGAREIENRRLLCGNPYTFQGDERDIIVLSMVAASNERIGALTTEADRRRFNVAASRARDQLWLFHSVAREDLSISCCRRRLLDFFENTRQPEIVGLQVDELRRQSVTCNRQIEAPPHPFDSWFEVDVALEIAGRGYRVFPQFEVAQKRIDLVIEGGQARLAVECDGDEFHDLTRYEEDMQRQRMLERCGWVFYRVRSSRFYGNRQTALEGLWAVLVERGISPQVGATEPNEESISEMEPDAEKVEVGDSVVYVEIENPDSEKQAVITFAASNPDWGIVNVNTPIARALLGARLSEVVEVCLSMGSKQLLIKGIRKPERRA